MANKTQNALLKTDSLQLFIESASINQEEKQKLLEQLPQFDLEERAALFRALTDIHLLDLEEKATLEKLKKFSSTVS